MIKLKNGKEVEYNKDFDLFFKNILEAVIKESYFDTEKNNRDIKNREAVNELFLKEIMDNCIFITHQLFEIFKTNQEMSKFIVTGFIFNSIVLVLPQFKDKLNDKDIETIH